MPNGYTSLNEKYWGTGGAGQEGHMKQAQIESDKRANDPSYGAAYTDEGLQNAIDEANRNGGQINGSIYSYSQYDTPRPEKAGDAGADEAKPSDGSYQYIQHCKDQYKQTEDPAMKAYWHEEAEKVRARAGYSGGADGSMYISQGEMDLAGGRGQYTPGGSNHDPGHAGGQGRPGSGADGMSGYLDAWRQMAVDQSNGQIDYAVQQGMGELNRALTDAQSQFKEQAESVDRNARQAMDNSALYAELRGDKGGIGQEQYNSIQNAAAGNHLAVQQAQVKLATDTQRQIADLRAQGEFKKADAALAVAQEYLTKLVQVEQWAAEFGLSREKFQADLDQWKAEYDLALSKLDLSREQWQADTAAAERKQLAEIGEALLKGGIMLSAAQLEALEMTEAQARE